jgi:hypothetical protein
MLLCYVNSFFQEFILRLRFKFVRPAHNALPDDPTSKDDMTEATEGMDGYIRKILNHSLVL